MSLNTVHTNKRFVVIDNGSNEIIIETPGGQRSIRVSREQDGPITIVTQTGHFMIGPGVNGLAQIIVV